MEKQEDNYSAPNFAGLDYPMDHHHHHHHHSNNYLLNNLPQQQQEQQLSFAEVMNFADFGPKLALNQTLISEEDRGLEAGNNNNNDEDDPVYFLKFPVLNDDEENDPRPRNNEERLFMRPSASAKAKDREEEQEEGNYNDQEEEDRDDDMSSVHLQFLGEDLQRSINNNNNESGSVIANPSGGSEPNNNAIATNTNNKKRKRPRSLKTSEEVESQRMTHIAVERNRRKQMNEHLRVLRSLMPGSYVQRGDQASIIGGAIEFVRELEQLLQCLESQKRRRLLGDQLPPGDSSSSGGVPVPPAPPFILAAGEEDCMTSSSAAAAASSSFREETAESKSCIADVEVRVAGFDAVIKILSRRRPGQLLKAISALEDLQFNILHTNITTIEHTVLYSFNVKVTSESSFSAEDIAISVQQIFSFIHASTTM